jgi:hypothetical protein
MRTRISTYRRIMRAIAGLSAAACVAIGILWMVSLFRLVGFGYSPHGVSSWTASAGHGGIVLSFAKVPMAGRARIIFGPLPAPLVVHHSFLGFGYSHFPATYMRDEASFYRVPIWFPLILSALPGLWAWRCLHAVRYVAAGKCWVCGYDIRATPERCPECGTSPGTSELGRTTPIK